MDDLISRKAALEAVKIPNGEYPNPSERHGIIIGRIEAGRRIREIPSVPAVPLDKLCEWLEVHARTPIYNMQHTAEWWEEELEKWMEEQHESN